MMLEHLDRIRQLFDAAVLLSPDERDAYLGRECADDSAVRAAVAELLSHDRQASHERFLLVDSNATGPIYHDGENREAGHDRPAANGTRYEPLRFHARGGLGEVLVARDAELDRVVAVKRIQGRYAGDPGSRRRFLREAAITARLEHPGIVPVHGLVQDESGQPCYAMRFVEGDTLADAIKRFHEADKPGRDAAERSVALRQLLGRFAAVCNTIAYAHSRGVVHRDLKPGNIILGKYGETLVVDWGLAKADAGGHESEDVEEHESPSLAPCEQSSWNGNDTKPGRAMGTLEYMSPEQATGQWDQVGPASDIYSLGATLQAILTGQAPFRRDDIRVVGSRVQRGHHRRPREVKTAVPAALEAVCLKAMAPKPEHRYRTALELAAEVEQWLADEPVNAYTEPLVTRFGRWLRRHRTRAAVGVTALLALSGVAVVAAVLSERGRRAVTTERDRAEKAIAQFFDVMNEIRWAVPNGPKGQSGVLLDVKRAIFTNLCKRLELLIGETGGNRDVQEASIWMNITRAQIERKLGKRSEYLAAAQKALEFAERFAQDNPESPEMQRLLALALQELAIAKGESGMNGQEERRRSEAINRSLVSRDHDESGYTARGLTYDLISNAVNESDPATALRGLEEAIIVRERMLRSKPADLDNRSELGYLYTVMSDKLKVQRRFPEAQATFWLACGHLELVVAEQPLNERFVSFLVRALHELGYFELRQKRLPEAIEALHRALAVSEEFLTRSRANRLDTLLPQRHRATSYYYLALAYQELDLAKVHRYSQECRNLCDKLLFVDDNDGDLHYILAVSCNNLVAVVETQRFVVSMLCGGGLGRLAAPHVVKDHLQSLPLLEEACASMQRVVELDPKVNVRRSELGEMLKNHGEVLSEAGRHQEAVQALKRAIEQQGLVVRAEPANGFYRGRLAGHHEMLASVYRKLDRTADAEAEEGEVRRLRQKQP